MFNLKTTPLPVDMLDTHIYDSIQFSYNFLVIYNEAFIRSYPFISETSASAYPIFAVIDIGLSFYSIML